MNARSHGERAYRAGCRCDVCRDWRRRANAICKARRARGLDKVLNPNHGTERRAASGCQCQPCTAAAERRRVRMQATNAASYAALTTEQRRAYRAQHRDAIRASAAKWRTANRDKARASVQAWKAKNPDKAKQIAKAWRDAHRAELRSYAQHWRAEHPDKVKAYAEKWRRTHRHPQHSPLWPFLPANTTRDQLIETITAAVPNIPQAIRADVCQDLAIVWLTTGTITNGDVRAAVSANWKLAPVLAGRELSLSTPAYRDGDGRETLADRLSA